MQDKYRFYWEEDHHGSDTEINIKLPGFHRSEIKVSLGEKFVEITAEKKSHQHEKGKGFYSEETLHKIFRKSIPLPEDMHPDDVSIKIGEGVVSIKKRH